MFRHLAGLALCFSVSACTAAASTLQFSYISFDNVDQASGTLVANDNGDGSFTAISGTGEYDGFTITLVLNPSGTGSAGSPSGYFNYDNQVFPTQTPALDNNGLLFLITGGPATELNLYSDPDTAYLNNGANNTGTVTVTILDDTQTPEPATFGLMGLALLGLAGMMRVRRLRE